jgi:3-oxoacyl-[acyl-carrier-protein] synthase II
MRRKRKARIYAEVAGYAATSEAYHMVIPREDGEEIAATMRLAIADAGVSASQIDYINAHATSTSIGDAVEAKAIRQVFRSRAGQDCRQRHQVAYRPYLGSRGAIGGVATVLGIHTGTDPSDRQL